MNKGRIAIGFLILTFLAGPLVWSQTSWKWTTETAAQANYGGSFTSLGLDSEGNVHISYRSSGNYILKYMTIESGIWVMESINESCSGRTSLALDSADAVHISFYSSGDLKYVTNKSGKWVVTVIDEEGTVGEYSSLGIDSSGAVHIAYYDGTNRDLKYATNSSGQWTTESIDTLGNSGEYCSLSLDSSDKVHISAYRDQQDEGETGELIVVSNESGQWATTIVDDDGDRGRHCAIACDATDQLHISYYDRDIGALRYTTNSSGSWQTEIADNPTSANVGGYTSITTDKQGKVHISYYNYSDQDLEYATNAGGSWDLSTIDGSRYENRGRYSSIAVDDNGMAHVSYERNATPTNLMYAYRTTYWNTRVLDDSAEAMGHYASLVLDSQDQAHIGIHASYHLRLMSQTPTGWAMTHLVSGGNVGAFCNMAIDATDHLHISYVNSMNSDILYTTNASDEWAFTTLAGDGRFMSLAVDDDGNCHIAYSRDSWLYYGNNTSGSWAINWIFDIGFYGGNTSMAIDENGKAHISLYDHNGNLRYITNVSGGWAQTTLYSSGQTFDWTSANRRCTSLALDPDGTVHIAYYDLASPSLKHAEIASGTWEIETIDDTTDVGSYVSLKRSSSGQLMAAYYDATNGDLKFAQETGEGWQATTVDSADDVGLFVSMALTSNDAPRIAYYDSTNASLKFATATQPLPPMQLLSTY